MKTIKNLFFSMATLVALSVSFTSCDALSDLTSKEVEVEAPAIEFSIGGTTTPGGSPQQKVGAAAADTVWYDKEVDISTKLNEELAKQGLKPANVKQFMVTKSHLALGTTLITGSIDFGVVNIFIDGKHVCYGQFLVVPGNTGVSLTYKEPFSIFEKFGAGKVQLKITSNRAKPTVKYDMKLVNTYLTKIALL